MYTVFASLYGTDPTVPSELPCCPSRWELEPNRSNIVHFHVTVVCTSTSGYSGFPPDETRGPEIDPRSGVGPRDTRYFTVQYSRDRGRGESAIARDGRSNARLDFSQGLDFSRYIAVSTTHARTRTTRSHITVVCTSRRVKP